MTSNSGDYGLGEEYRKRSEEAEAGFSRGWKRLALPHLRLLHSDTIFFQKAGRCASSLMTRTWTRYQVDVNCGDYLRLGLPGQEWHHCRGISDRALEADKATESEDRASLRAPWTVSRIFKIRMKAQKEPAVLYYINKAYLTGVKNQRTLMATENMMIFWS